MPFKRIPIVHRFGIISYSQKLQLHKRLVKQALQQSSRSKKPQMPQQSVLEEFVQQYNSADLVHDSGQISEKADKILARIKRRAGVKTDGVGDHVDLSVAWTDLVQLSECNGPVQGKCLHVLLTSLERAPVSAEHIVVLCFLAETTLYWLMSADGSGNDGHPSTGWVAKLNIGRLVFMRLFHHHMTGQLDGWWDAMSRLYTYLDGFTAILANFATYPDVLYNLRYIHDVCTMLVAGNERGEMEGETEGDKEEDEKTAADMVQPDTVLPADPTARTVTVHDLCPTLWHSLDIWRCAQIFSGCGLHNALPALAQCAGHLASESWIDAVCALHILGDASIYSLPVLNTLQGVTCGLLPTPVINVPDRTSAATDLDHDTEVPGASYFQDTTPEQDEDDKDCAKTNGILGVVSGNQPSPSQHSVYTDKTSPVGVSCHPGSADTGWLAQHGTAMAFQRHEDELAFPASFTNTPLEGIIGMRGWRWEVAVTYVHVLTSVCIYGATSNIQKVALLGRNREATNVVSGVNTGETPMKSAGLLDLLSFHALHETSDGGPNDWSWRVRYAALSGTQRLCDACSRADETRSGIGHAAWRAMTLAKSKERDRRVLDAIRVAEMLRTDGVDQHDDRQMAPPTIGSRIASSLVSLYLPTTCEVRQPTKHKASAKPLPVVQLHYPKATQRPTRTSLREDIALANSFQVPIVDFKTRTYFDLRRIVEDQWRKQCHAWTNTATDDDDTCDDTISAAGKKADKTSNKETDLKTLSAKDATVKSNVSVSES